MSSWRQIQKQNFTDWKKLAAFLELNPSQITKLLERSHFPLNLPLRLAAKMAKETLDDPILRQFVPLKQELESNAGFVTDPVGDQPARRTSKLLHKYEGRALILATGACAMHCRYCFRQNFDYETEEKGFDEELRVVAGDPSIEELMLSGGDPLSLSDQNLGALLSACDAIFHLKRIRFHTRFPIGIPERITDDFLKLLEGCRAQVIFVVHVNHALELDHDVIDALKKIQKLGIPVLSQSVLLRGVNDTVDTLKDLFTKLTNHGMIPYYLHQLDRVKGTAHFEVPVEIGLELMDELQTQLPGYAIPKFVQEIAGEKSKTVLS